MTNLYKQRDNHFSDVSAKAIVKDGKQVGKIAIKYMKSGVVHVYVHAFGSEMKYGRAGGYGYDKVGAAIGNAMEDIKNDENADELYKTLKDVTYDGEWDNVIREAGYELFSVL